MTADSVPRQPICRFTISRTPPFPLVVSPVCVALYRCVPCGIFRGTWSLGVVTRAKRRGSVARVCRLTPLCSRTTLCLLSLLHHRGRWVSLTYHAILVWGPRFGVSLPQPTGTDSQILCTHSDTIPLLSNSHLPLPTQPIEVLLDLRRDHVGFPTYSRDTTSLIVLGHGRTRPAG